MIDLHKTIPLIEKAYEFIKNAAANGTVLFVGTKKQAMEAIEEEAKKCGMFYVNQRWMGGTLTNFKTLKKNIARLNDIEKMKEDGSLKRFPKKEILNMEKKAAKLEKSLGGIKNMNGLPDVVFVVDPHKENIAVQEARKMNIPVVAIVDSNCDPTEIDYVIPGNDDAIRAIRLLTSRIAQACSQGLKIREERLQAESDKEQEEVAVAEEERAYAAATPEDLELQAEMETATEVAEAEYPE